MTRIATPYVNNGNSLVLSMIPQGVRRILGVGCGGGDNARIIRDTYPGVQVVGLTASKQEAEIASSYMDTVHVTDLNSGLADDVMKEWGDTFDLLLFSHVLEHLIEPVAVLRRCLTKLRLGGHVLIAVPNVLEWRTRMRFILGDFTYADHGVLDRTHFRIFAYETASLELLDPVGSPSLIERRSRGSVPLGPLRRLGFAPNLCAAIDRSLTQRRPNLFASETALLARWSGDTAQ